MDRKYSGILEAERGTCKELAHGYLAAIPKLPYLLDSHDGEFVLRPELHAAVACHPEDECTYTALPGCTILG